MSDLLTVDPPPFADWSPVLLAPSAQVTSDRCLHFPHPRYAAAPSGFVVVMGSDSGQTRLANASLKPSPADRDAVFISVELARQLKPRSGPAADDTFNATLRSAKLRDLFIYGGSRFLPLWLAVFVALAGLLGLVVRKVSPAANERR